MKIVINIPPTLKQIVDDDDFKAFTHVVWQQILIEALKNGTPLPEGHGRLIDADKVEDSFIKWSMSVQGYFSNADITSIICNSLTIIDADKEGEE